jgi:hypothetical protein
MYTDMKDTHDQVNDILARNAMFYESNPGDQKKYSVGPEVIEVLTWCCMHLGIPIIVAAASSKISEIVKSKFKAKSDAPVTQEDIKDIKEDVKKVIEFSRTQSNINYQVNRQPAMDLVREHLEFHGWPNELANSDATKIVDIFGTRDNNWIR